MNEKNKFNKPALKNIHPYLEEYDGGAAYFIKPFGFCCDDPWDYITNNGEYPEYWYGHESAYEAIEYYLEDRGWMEIISIQKKLEKQIADLTACLKMADEKLKLYGDEENWSKYGECIFSLTDLENYIEIEDHWELGLQQILVGKIGGKRAREYLQSPERLAIKNYWEGRSDLR